MSITFLLTMFFQRSICREEDWNMELRQSTIPNYRVISQLAEYALKPQCLFFFFSVYNYRADSEGVHIINTYRIYAFIFIYYLWQHILKSSFLDPLNHQREIALWKYGNFRVDTDIVHYECNNSNFKLKLFVGDL